MRLGTAMVFTIVFMVLEWRQFAVDKSFFIRLPMLTTRWSYAKIGWISLRCEAFRPILQPSAQIHENNMGLW
jgi:hypothetical protein